jgi:hypothetical protein
MRAVLDRQSRWKTLPQIYLGGEFIGGCSDLFDGINNGAFAGIHGPVSDTLRQECECGPLQPVAGMAASTPGMIGDNKGRSRSLYASAVDGCRI